MSRFFKTILLWILIAVVPLHAAAATIGMSCGPAHQAAMEHASVPVADHGDQSAADHQHHDMVAADAVPGDDHQPEKSPHAKCSACSAFCIGAVAPPSGFISIPTFSGSEALVVSASTVVSGHVPEGLKRPPRPLFA